MNLGTRNHTRNAFTIVELLIVIVIIAILAAITLVAYAGIRDRAVASVLQSDVANAIKKIELYKVESGTEAFPSDQNAAIGAGVTVSEGNTLTYWTPSAINSYCVQVTNGSSSYFATNGHAEPTPGTCYQLIGWWPLNSASGDDWSGLGYASDSRTGNPSATTGATGADAGAALFSEPDSIGIPNNTLISGTQSERTVSIWLRADSTSGTTIVYEQGGTSNGISIAMADGTLYGTFYNSTGTAWNASVSTPLDVGTWHHFVATYSGSEGVVRGYLDGILIGTNTSAGSSIQSHTGGIALGRMRNDTRLYNGTAVGGYGYGFSGGIDDFRLYNTTLDEATIRFMYEAGPQ